MNALMRYFRSVSYTHLDVYKRQPLLPTRPTTAPFGIFTVILSTALTLSLIHI